ncbi:MAG: TaqI-like C-terminal specificity domain-containing protein, partial [Candidatus Paceibacterota bacterium]
KLTASIDDEKQFCLNTVMCFSKIEETGLSNEFLVGLINSKLMSFYFYYFIFNQAIRTMHFMPGYADRLPIHNNSKSFHNDISDLVNKILKVKSQNSEADTSKLDQEIDRLVYELYGLNEEEIGIVEGL